MVFKITRIINENPLFLAFVICLLYERVIELRFSQYKEFNLNMQCDIYQVIYIYIYICLLYLSMKIDYENEKLKNLQPHDIRISIGDSNRCRTIGVLKD